MQSSKTRECFTLFLLLLLHNEVFGRIEKRAEKNETIDYRLPRVTIPESYEIKLIPEIVEGNFTFYGESRIGVRILVETPNVTLHSKDLQINENFTSLLHGNGIEQKPTKHSYVNATNFLIIEFDPPIMPGANYILSLKYNGKMANVPEGIYNSSYVKENGEKVWLVATKFTQIHARRAFPCWDEPDLKATFNLSIKHYPNYTAESNMMARQITFDSDGKQWTNFEVTPHMSTDILAFVVSDFHCLHYKLNEFNVCGRKDILPYLKYSRDVSQRALVLLEKYFDSKYALSKLSQFAVPDATTGATENWGLIIYRESSFAYEPFVHPVSTKEYTTLTIIHELAHQWIGNYVTPVSWKYSWIKEGLPSFLQYYIIDKLFPDWREMDTFVTRVIQDAAFSYDSIDNYKHFEWYSNNPADIRSKFSPQIYSRGAAIFHMISNILGEATFKAGVVKFVKQHAYGLFASSDLWSALQSAYMETKKESASSSLLIEEIMKPWIEQQGYPVINVTRDQETGKIVIKQEGNLATQKSNRWWIPINFATSSNPDFTTTTSSHWLKPNNESLIIDGINKDDWIIVNIQQSGYYRVDYDQSNWKRIAEYMNSENYTKIHVRNRAQLINDLFYMASLNRQNYTTFLDLIRYLSREDEYQPWLTTFQAIKKLRRVMYNEDVDKELKKFVTGLMEKVIKKIGFEDRSKYDWIKKYKSMYDNLDNVTKKCVPTEKALEKFYKSEDFLPRRYRAKFLSFACSLGHTLCLESAKTQLRAHFENATENPISSDLVSWVKCHGAAGFEEELLKRINGSDIKYLLYLCCSPNKTVLQNYIDRILAGEVNATTKQTRIAFGYLGEDTSTNLENAINYFVKNYKQIYEYFEKSLEREKSSTNVTVYVTSILNEYIWEIRKLDQIKIINEMYETLDAESHPLPPIVKDSIENQMKKIEWSDENASILGEWLHDYSLNASFDT